ncbi:MAG TPA: hypothetical protein VGQ49_11325 [Bryobacteraceae bacterium]|jgi:hypothetical protein|nr:hypothetical protein [Bryobacteraceae bacterium]
MLDNVNLGPMEENLFQPVFAAHTKDDDAKRPSDLLLQLKVSDPEVSAALRSYAEGEPRNQFALGALRLGVLALRAAVGQIDTGEIRNAGQKLMSDVKSLLMERSGDLTNEITSSLKQYFDPQTGLLPQRIQALIQNDGDLEKLLRTHLAPQDSVMAKTLAAHLGEGSPIFRMLSPNEANGLKAQVAGALELALAEQRQHILREFSLDNKDSALARLVTQLTTNNGQLQSNLQEQVVGLVNEFSLDQPDSALSRLVSRVEAAHTSIADQFSIDNEQSAMTRLSKMLQNTSDHIDKNLTLDDDKSALSRLKRELQGTLDSIAEKNSAFQSEVRATLSALQARREEAARSTQHGHTFEEQLGEVLVQESQRQGDIPQATGSTTGLIKNCKIGDYVVELGADSAAPGARIVWEAKDDQSYDLKRALGEIEEARKNRQAQIGVFVFSKSSAPVGQPPFARHGCDLVIIWEPEDASSDIYIKVASSVARALAIRQKQEKSETTESIQEVERATRAIEKQLQYLDEFKKWGDTVKGHGEKISDRAERMKKDLLKEVEALDQEVSALKAEAA